MKTRNEVRLQCNQIEDRLCEKYNNDPMQFTLRDWVELTLAREGDPTGDPQHIPGFHVVIETLGPDWSDWKNLGTDDPLIQGRLDLQYYNITEPSQKWKGVNLILEEYPNGTYLLRVPGENCVLCR